ncbi:MAG: hypothetical protein AB7V58_06030 [Solirubrobacterales bacterium]
MHSQDIPRRCDSPPAQVDRKIEGEVLAFVLDQHPDQLSEAELCLAFNRDCREFSSADAIARAIGELVGGGLLHRRDAFVLPTRPALYYSRLEVEW